MVNKLLFIPPASMTFLTHIFLRDYKIFTPIYNNMSKANKYGTTWALVSVLPSPAYEDLVVP